MAEISQEELEERVAIVRRFKALLEQQRGKFQEYLTVLEKQQDSIATENPENLLAHTELEQQIVRSLSTLQKVIVPMNTLYKKGAHEVAGSQAKDEAEIKKIQDDLSDLQMKVLRQNEINRDLLRLHIDQLKNQINGFKNPYRNNRSVYASAQPQKVATLVQVDA